MKFYTHCCQVILVNLHKSKLTYELCAAKVKEDLRM